MAPSIRHTALAALSVASVAYATQAPSPTITPAAQYAKHDLRSVSVPPATTYETTSPLPLTK